MLPNSCAVCKKEAPHSCSACNEIYYCSKEHQKQDWKKHKHSCAPYKIQTDPVLGRYVVAIRDIDPGEVIMKKLPLVLGPKMISTPLCLGCHKKLNLEAERYECRKCRWPLCGEICENSKNHQEECKLFAKNKFKSTIQNDFSKQSVYSSIIPLRALLLKRSDPNKFKLLTECQSHLNEHKKTQVYEILRKNLVPLFTEILKLDTNEEEILNLCSIFDTNSFEVRDAKGLVNIRGLYPVVNFLSHDCKHNTKHNFLSHDFQLVLTATVPIKKNEPITTTYTQTLWGTLTRRAHLKMSKLFDCMCKRCKDPTELGIYAGAIFCSHCQNGRSKMLSLNPLDQNSSWKCEDCYYEIQSKQIIWGNESLRKEITLLEKNSPKAFEDFLIKYQNTLHERNSHFLEVKYALSQMYGNMSGYELDELPVDLLERKINLCHELLDVAGILEPGYSRFRGSLLYDLQAAIVMKAKADFAEERITKAEAEAILREAVCYLHEASKILASEPDLNEVLQNRLRNLGELLIL